MLYHIMERQEQNIIAMTVSLKAFVTYFRNRTRTRLREEWPGSF